MRMNFGWVVTTLAFLSGDLLAAEKLVAYDQPAYGFSVSLPGNPEIKVVPAPTGDGTLSSFRSLNDATVRQYTVFVGRPRDRGIYEGPSMDAFLDGSIKGYLSGMQEGKVVASKRVTFQGMPAMEYTLSQVIEDVPMTSRGVTFMIDGGHMRLSMLHVTSDAAGAGQFETFKRSFKLLPIQYRPGQQWSGRSGISFRPPEGWVADADLKNAFELASYHSLTRSLRLIASGDPNYGCQAFAGELKRSGATSEIAQVTLNGKAFTKIVAFEDVPKYNVRLTNVHYCLDTRGGAVALGGTEEQSQYWRWAPVFEGAAGSISVR